MYWRSPEFIEFTTVRGEFKRRRKTGLSSLIGLWVVPYQNKLFVVLLSLTSKDEESVLRM